MDMFDLRSSSARRGAAALRHDSRCWFLILALVGPQAMWAQDTKPAPDQVPSFDNVSELKQPASRSSEINPQQPAETARRFVAELNLEEPLTKAALDALSQSPDQHRWSGRAGSTLFAVAALPLPRRARAVALPSRLKLATVVAVHELLQNDALLARYETQGLEDAKTLRQAVLQSAGKLNVAGTVKGLTFRARRQDNFVVALVYAGEKDFVTKLSEPEKLQVVKTQYRDVMHAQIRQLMAGENWQDAVKLWRHLQQRNLVSTRLYLDAARCFQALGQHSDTVRVVDEALTAFAEEDNWTFFEQAGDLVLTIDTTHAQELAERAFTISLKKFTSLSSTVNGNSNP